MKVGHFYYPTSVYPLFKYPLFGKTSEPNRCLCTLPLDHFFMVVSKVESAEDLTSRKRVKVIYQDVIGWLTFWPEDRFVEERLAE